VLRARPFTLTWRHGHKRACWVITKRTAFYEQLQALTGFVQKLVGRHHKVPPLEHYSHAQRPRSRPATTLPSPTRGFDRWPCHERAGSALLDARIDDAGPPRRKAISASQTDNVFGSDIGTSACRCWLPNWSPVKSRSSRLLGQRPLSRSCSPPEVTLSGGSLPSSNSRFQSAGNQLIRGPCCCLRVFECYSNVQFDLVPGISHLVSS
jgi:hypothetical protein